MDCAAAWAAPMDAQKIQPNDLRAIVRTIRIIATAPGGAASLKES